MDLAIEWLLTLLLAQHRVWLAAAHLHSENSSEGKPTNLNQETPYFISHNLQHASIATKITRPIPEKVV